MIEHFDRNNAVGAVVLALLGAGAVLKAHVIVRTQRRHHRDPPPVGVSGSRGGARRSHWPESSRRPGESRHGLRRRYMRLRGSNVEQEEKL